MSQTGSGRSHRDAISLVEVFRLFPRRRCGRRVLREAALAERHRQPTAGAPASRRAASPRRCRSGAAPSSARSGSASATGTVIQGSNLRFQVWAIATYLMTTNLKQGDLVYEAAPRTLEVATDRVRIPARARCDGWFIFTFDVNIRPADFKHFRMQVRAISEPLERFRFEPYDWEDAKKGGTKIVLLPPRWRWRH